MKKNIFCNCLLYYIWTMSILLVPIGISSNSGILWACTIFFAYIAVTRQGYADRIWYLMRPLISGVIAFDLTVLVLATKNIYITVTLGLLLLVFYNTNGGVLDEEPTTGKSGVSDWDNPSGPEQSISTD